MKKIDKKNIQWIDFSCMKASEGGMSKKDTLDLLKSDGVICDGNGYSPYVGHYGIRVAKQHDDKASKILWG
jgi:hypothetical protein